VLKEDPSTYCLKLLTRFENEFGMESFVDYISIHPYHWFGIYTGSYVTDKNGNNIIYLPHTTDKELFKELFYHELGHAIFQHYKLPKNITNILNPIVTNGHISYRYRILTNNYKNRPEGMCSSYSLIDQEEEFAELTSFILCNKNRHKKYSFNGEEIELSLDLILSKKVSKIKNFFKIP
jgi:hypothetical protein